MPIQFEAITSLCLTAWLSASPNPSRTQQTDPPRPERYVCLATQPCTSLDQIPPAMQVVSRRQHLHPSPGPAALPNTRQDQAAADHYLAAGGEPSRVARVGSPAQGSKVTLDSGANCELRGEACENEGRAGGGDKEAAGGRRKKAGLTKTVRTVPWS